MYSKTAQNPDPTWNNQGDRKYGKSEPVGLILVYYEQTTTRVRTRHGETASFQMNSRVHGFYALCLSMSFLKQRFVEVQRGKS